MKFWSRTSTNKGIRAFSSSIKTVGRDYSMVLFFLQVSILPWPTVLWDILWPRCVSLYFVFFIGCTVVWRHINFSWLDIFFVFHGYRYIPCEWRYFTEWYCFLLCELLLLEITVICRDSYFHNRQCVLFLKWAWIHSILLIRVETMFTSRYDMWYIKHVEEKWHWLN